MFAHHVYRLADEPGHRAQYLASLAGLASAGATIVDPAQRKTRVRRHGDHDLGRLQSRCPRVFSNTSTSASKVTTALVAKRSGSTGTQLDTFFRVVLPLGISFYTFQALSYTIDVYRGEAEAMANFIDFSCFVSMFPHLVAGPILKFSFLADQLKHRALTSDKFARGVAFFMLGLAKKILLANPCGKIADTAFDAGSIRNARRVVRVGRRTRSRFISISAATPTWRSGSA